AALVVGAVLLAALGWQYVAVKRAEAHLQSERQTLSQQFQADRSALVNELEAKADANADETKRQFGMALAWAVRGEMIRNNLDQVDQFFTEIIKLPHTERVLLADSAGKVRVSTDRRYLGVALSTLVPVEATLPDEVAVRAGPNETKLLVVPVMGLNSRLGTVVVSYREPHVLAGS
ncbi:MAG: hypothetical protein ACM3KD_07345, partial [Hyphomicrobiaceae bacterium]